MQAQWAAAQQGVAVAVVDQPPDDPTAEAWQALEREDPLAAASRFHRLRVATGSPGHTLHEVLARLESEDRRNVLIVPAVFYADASWMRELDQSVRDFRDSMTLHWLPGLGGTRPAD